MERRLIVEVEEYKQKIKGRIQVQTHYKDKFSFDGDTFVASNGFKLVSEQDIACTEDTLYVRKSADYDRTFDVPNQDTLEKLAVAIHEYTKKHSPDRTYEIII